MDTRHVRAFVAVADELHMGRAAERLAVNQPTLSRQVAALERELGVPLFDRSRRRLALTPAGAEFVEGARGLVRRAETLVDCARRAQRGELGVLRVGFVQSATFRALPRLLAGFREVCPDVEVRVTAMTTLSQKAALRDGSLDAGLFRPFFDEPGIATRTLSRDPLVAALPAGHPLAVRDRIALADLAGEEFVCYSRESGPSVYDRIVGHCLAAGFTPRITQDALDVQTIVALVAAGVGVSLLIAPTPHSDERAVVFRPLTDDLPLWELALAWSPANRSKVLARLLDTVSIYPEDSRDAGVE
ncbi:LysR family transcriptional regulator [Actinophytocola gossypii]|uniref:LysR family transcriptional regulator n=1 Tax=Actinophytocola gossypii TaxID=2812003 RepID=A0ABT2JK31_9PSEU|nr:LysR family transcriptional regulator [Actinophytocola gossypii]MCT2587884.1 LysR family transcriptional regulator [Actinophytocola gossypii]